MREIKLTPAGGERHTRSVAIGWRGVIIIWGSLQERRATTQVMLGLSLRARWDATLVYIVIDTAYYTHLFDFIISILLMFSFFNSTLGKINVQLIRFIMNKERSLYLFKVF